MKTIPHDDSKLRPEGEKGGLEWSRIRYKLFFTIVPSVVLILLLAGWISHRVTIGFVNQGIRRTVHLQARAMAHALESLLEDCRQSLTMMVSGPVSSEILRDYLARISFSGATSCAELIWLQPSGTTVLVNRSGGDGEVQITLNAARLPGADSFWKKSRLNTGEVLLGPVEDFNSGLGGAPVRPAQRPVLRMGTLVPSDHGGGILLLTVPLESLRQTLSRYNSSESPIWSFPRSHEVRYSYFIDAEGWILFQSSDDTAPGSSFSTFLAREGMDGTLGKAGLPNAFRPSKTEEKFWNIVQDIQKEEHGTFLGAQSIPDLQKFGKIAEQFSAYSPVIFRNGKQKSKQLAGGVVFIDRSRLPLQAGYSLVDAMFLVTLGSSLLVTFLLFVLGRRLTRPLYELTNSVENIHKNGDLCYIKMSFSDYETTVLANAINRMIKTMRQQLDAIHVRDMTIASANMRERATSSQGKVAGKGSAAKESHHENLVRELIGSGPLIEKLKIDILKAAAVDVDVLIHGETGTGKQLTAEAIHRNSCRREKPLISINCGELDENLLLDTLFGHVKGAYTEAKTDRKGAFVQAQGSILFLDEIQSASSRVQQALLRAISMRKIKPLGSDVELDVNVRVIAATNVDLKDAIKQKKFREDLYYRLRVINIETPSLRKHPESIGLLAEHYLLRAQSMANKNGLAFSRGALLMMESYAWPGNVRELKNCITRAVIMADTSTIQATDLHLPLQVDHEISSPDMRINTESQVDTGSSESRSWQHESGALANLNQRQQQVLPQLFAMEELTRRQYEELCGALPTRTAINDLTDLVARGVLERKGRGPSTRYQVRSPYRLSNSSE
jgi:DNA-binding NtrC family response regulator